jgi:ComF family protein
LLPPRCVLCGALGQAPCIDLCAGCEQSLPVTAMPCIAVPLPLERSFAPFTYGYPLDHLVHALKYRGQLAVARVLGGLLGQRIEALALGVAIDVLVPVPLHPRRHAERGFNQSVEIANWVAKRLRRTVDESIAARCRDTPPQVGLRAEERRRNLAGAFSAAPGVRGLRVAIVDDVYTTGATLLELGQALHHAGARSVEAWCVGRAMAPKQVDLARDR